MPLHASLPEAAPASTLPWLDAGTQAAEAAEADDAADASVDGPYVSGRTWVSCMRGFRTEATLMQDLIRLGNLCGPYHGMKRVGPPVQAELKAGETHRQSFEAKRNQCFRVFSVWDAGLTHVSMRAVDAQGGELAQARGTAGAHGGFAALGPRGAFCVPETGTGELEFRAEQGKGAFALQLWLLP